MDETVTKLTVMFEPPFWIELFEREADGKYFVCKYTFGPEPKDYEVYELILSRFCRLQFSPPGFRSFWEDADESQTDTA